MIGATATPARAVAAGTALVVAGVLPGFLVASLATRLDRDFGFGPSELGLTVAAFYVVSGVASTPAGRFAERAGATRAVRWSAAVSCASSLTIAAVAGSAASLVPLLALAGVGNALAVPAASALFHGRVPARRQGLAFGLMQAGGPLGALLAGVALPAVAIPLGWPWAFALAAVVAVLAALGAGQSAGAPARVSGDDPRPPAGRRTDVRLLAVVAALASAATMGMVSFLVVYAVGEGMSESLAGGVLAGASLGAALGRIGLGGLADRGGDPLATVAAMLAASTAGYALLLTGAPAGIVAGAVIVGAIGWSWPGPLALAAVRRAGTAPAWAVGVMMTGLFAGAMGGPFAAGHVADRGDYTWTWLLCAALAAAAAAMAAWTLRRRS